jgi:hypothetical protein
MAVGRRCSAAGGTARRLCGRELPCHQPEQHGKPGRAVGQQGGDRRHPLFGAKLSSRAASRSAARGLNMLALASACRCCAWRRCGKTHQARCLQRGSAILNTMPDRKSSRGVLHSRRSVARSASACHFPLPGRHVGGAAMSASVWTRARSSALSVPPAPARARWPSSSKALRAGGGRVFVDGVDLTMVDLAVAASDRSRAAGERCLIARCATISRSPTLPCRWSASLRRPVWRARLYPGIARRLVTRSLASRATASPAGSASASPSLVPLLPIRDTDLRRCNKLARL